MTVPQLRAQLKAMGLPSSGLKAVLVARLAEALQASEAQGGAAEAAPAAEAAAPADESKAVGGDAAPAEPDAPRSSANGVHEDTMALESTPQPQPQPQPQQAVAETKPSSPPHSHPSAATTTSAAAAATLEGADRKSVV